MPGREAAGTRDPTMGSPHRATPVPRPAQAGSRNRAMGYDQLPEFQTGNAVTEPDVPPS